MISSNIFLFSFLIYLISFFLYIAGVSKEDRDYRYGFRSSIFAFIIHTFGLLVRYYEAGLIELKAFEESYGRIPTGMERLEIILSHPPFTNLYESLIFVLWGIALVYLIINHRFRLNIIGLAGSALVVTGMGLTSLLPDKSITPLIPALKSWWLHLHVITASFAYGAFLIAAVVALLYLLKEGTPLYKFIAIFSFTIAILFLMMVSFKPLEYGATLMGSQEDGKIKPAVLTVMIENRSEPINITLKRPSIAVGSMAFVMTVLTIAGGILLLRRKDLIKAISIYNSVILFIYLIALLFLTTSKTIGLDKKELADIINFSLIKAGVDPSLITSMNFNIYPPYRVSLSSYPYQFSMTLMLLLISLFFTYLSFKPESFTNRLPQSQRLDTISYRTILFAFPMMTFVILTGAIWAHYAWGRYWGWDPKETWSLITWLVYAFYLHSRHVLKWSNKRAAIIAVIGFAVVIFTYIGVNLGLTGSGLHVYGSK